MKKILVLSAFAFFASASLDSNNVQAKKGSYIWFSNGCYYHVVTHSILWGAIEWEEAPRLIGCGSGFA